MGDPPRAVGAVPGLRTWASVLLIILAGFAAFAIASGFAEERWNADIASSLAAEVQTIESIPPEGKRTARAVVIIGTSLIRAATSNPGQPDTFPPSIQLMVITGRSGTTASVEDLIPALLRAHPDLVLLEANLLRRPPTDDSPFLVRRARHVQWALLTDNDHFWAPACPGLVGRKSAKAGGTNEQYQAQFASSNSNPDRLPLLVELKAGGIQVGVLDMPRSTELETAAPNLLMWRNIISTAAAKQGVAMWSAPGYWPVDYFCDLAHLNSEGAVVFSKWLASRLEQALNLSQ